MTLVFFFFFFFLFVFVKHKIRLIVPDEIYIKAV